MSQMSSHKGNNASVCKSGQRALSCFSMAMLALLLSGCQTTGEMKKLQDSNRSLQSQLSAANSEIASLKQKESELTSELNKTKQVLGVMGSEKQSRVQESSALRQQARNFLLGQVDSMRNFLLESNLNDYVGGEQVGRKLSEKGSIFIADFSHPMPKGGQLLGASVFTTAACPISVRVMRKIEDEFVIIWQGPKMEAARGANRLMFPVAVGVEAGDVAAYYFPDALCVAFDKGTGDFRYLNSDNALGTAIRATRFDGANEKRMYSIGVFGLLK